MSCWNWLSYRLALLSYRVLETWRWWLLNWWLRGLRWHEILRGTTLVNWVAWHIRNLRELLSNRVLLRRCHRWWHNQVRLRVVYLSLRWWHWWLYWWLHRRLHQLSLLLHARVALLLNLLRLLVSTWVLLLGWHACVWGWVLEIWRFKVVSQRWEALGCLNWWCFCEALRHIWVALLVQLCQIWRFEVVVHTRVADWATR
jgi:hypothetical protein